MKKSVLKRFIYSFLVLVMCAAMYRIKGSSEDESLRAVNNIEALSQQELQERLEAFMHAMVRLRNSLSEEAPALEQALRGKHRIDTMFSLADQKDAFRNKLFDAFLSFDQIIMFDHDDKAASPLLDYAQSDIDRAHRLFNRLIADNEHYVIMQLLQHLEGDIKTLMCQKAMNTRLLPPLYHGDYFSQARRKKYERFKNPHYLSLISPGRRELQDIPFNYNHLPVLWLTEAEIGYGVSRLDKTPCGDTEQLVYNSRDPVYASFVSALYYSSWLIIASEPLLCALYSAIYSNKNFKTAGRDYRNEMKKRIKDDWEVYRVPDSQYYVWVPRRQMRRYKNILNIEQLIALKSAGQALEHEHIQSCPTWIVANKRKLPSYYYSQDDAKKIFKLYADYGDNESKRAIIDFGLVGHGIAGKYARVVDIPVSVNIPEKKRLTSLLSFINDSLWAGTVAVASCSAGGSNKLLLQEIAAGVPLQYNYNLILRSISDKRTGFGTASTYAYWQRYFADAAKLGSAQSDMSILCKHFGGIASPTSGDVHGFASLPQVLLPGGSTFSGCAELSTVLEVTKALIKKGRPIDIRNKSVVLWHGADVQQLIVIHPGIIPTRIGVPPLEPPIVRLRDDRLVGKNQPLIYPEFVAMDRTKPILHFKHIKLINEGAPLTGVLHFIRDAFFDVGGIASKMHIVIDRLDGINDIPWQIENAQRQVGIERSDAFKQLWQQTAGHMVTFENVYVAISPKPGNKSYALTLVMSDPRGRQWASQFSFQNNRLARPELDSYHWKFARTNVRIPTVRSTGKRIPSEGSKRYQSIQKKLAGSVRQLQEFQEPLEVCPGTFFVENHPHTLIPALESTLEHMGLPPLSEEQSDRLKTLVRAFEGSTEEGKAEIKDEIFAELLDISPALVFEKKWQFRETFEHALMRAMLRERAATRKAITGKMGVEEELRSVSLNPLQQAAPQMSTDLFGKLRKELRVVSPKQLQQTASQIQQAASQISIDLFGKFGAEALRAAVKDKELLKKKLNSTLDPVDFGVLRKDLVKNIHDVRRRAYEITIGLSPFFTDKEIFKQSAAEILDLSKAFVDELTRIVENASDEEKYSAEKLELPKIILRDIPSWYSFESMNEREEK